MVNKFIFTGLIVFGMLVFGTVVSAAEIHDAVREGDAARVSALLASDSSLAQTVDERGRTPLHAAVRAENPELAELLIRAGAPVEAKDSAGWTALLMAANMGNRELVETLLDGGADVSPVLEPYGLTTASFAFTYDCRTGTTDLLPLLISHGAEFDPDAINPMGNMPQIFFPIHFGNSAMFEYLLTLGADVNVVRERDGRTPIAEAAGRGRIEIVKHLLDRGADFMTPDKDGKPPIRLAVEKGHIEIARLLIEKGAAVDLADTVTGRTLLHLAAMKGYKDVAELLIDNGGKLNVVDKSGKTPIQYAARYGNKQIADLLADHGAKLPDRAETNYGKSPYLDKGIAPGSAVAWLLNNRGWAVKTPRHFLVFDYEAFGQVYPAEPSLANGFMDLREIRNQDMLVLYSCFHAEPGELGYLHTLEDSLSSVAYINNRDDRWRGCRNTTYLGPDESRDFGNVQVYAIRPTSEDFMPNLAYLVKADGMSIFYSAFATDDTAAYKMSIESLGRHTDKIDLAVLPIPEPGEEESSDLRIFLQRWNPRAICLTDPNYRVDLFPAVAEQIRQWGFQAKVFCAENPGDKFIYSALGN